MILPKQVNLAKLAFLLHQANEEAEIQARVIKARELYAGYMDEDLATKTAEFLIGGESEDVEGINLMAIALNTTVRRLNIQDVKAIPPKKDQETQQTEDSSQLLLQSGFYKKIFDYNRVASLQKDLHRWTERDGESFLIIDYDPEAIWENDETDKGLARFYIHERYTDPGVTWKSIPGSGEGCKAHYRNDDVNQELDMVSKRWIEMVWDVAEEEFIPTQRMTLYINELGVKEGEGDYMPARIEKFVIGESGDWEEYQDENDEQWPIWWTDNATETGNSLPIPIIHFRNEELEPGSKKLWGLQHGMDQLFSAFLSAGTMTGHQLLVALGFFPTTDGKEPEEDGGNLMTVGPRQILGTASKGPREADLKTIPPSPIDPIMQSMDKLAIFASFVGSLPVSNFIFSKAVASSETLRQGDAELVARVNELQALLSNSWADVFKLARKLDVVFGSKTWDEKLAIRFIWSPAERRDIKYLHTEAEAKREAGVPEYIILTEVYGYGEQEALDMIAANQKEAQEGIGPETHAQIQGGTSDETTQQPAQTQATSEGSAGNN